LVPITTRAAPPVVAPLLPYTTLFRSAHRPAGEHRPHPELPGDRHLRIDGDVRAVGKYIVMIGGGRAPGLQQFRHREGGGEFECLDRKSTRLNSSHVSISYAVFCLKRK